MTTQADWMLPGEAARTLKVTRQAVARYAQRGLIPGVYRTPTGQHRYPRAIVLALAASLAVPAELPPAGPARTARP